MNKYTVIISSSPVSCFLVLEKNLDVIIRNWTRNAWVNFYFEQNKIDSSISITKIEYDFIYENPNLFFGFNLC